MATKNDELKATLTADPGNPVFADYAEHLRLAGQKTAGIEVCLHGLTLNPNCHKGRLILARIFYDYGFIPFAVRELEFLCNALPENKSLKRLLEKLSPESKARIEASSKPVEEGEKVEKAAPSTVAETDFSFDDLEMIEEAEKES